MKVSNPLLTAITPATEGLRCALNVVPRTAHREGVHTGISRFAGPAPSSENPYTHSFLQEFPLRLGRQYKQTPFYTYLHTTATYLY